MEGLVIMHIIRENLNMNIYIQMYEYRFTP